MNEIHYFDLDGTLWETKAKVWIIDKLYPNNPIIKIDIHTYNLLCKGFYISDNKKINYNGNEFWLSNELLTKIKKRKSIELDRIGISIREFINIDLISKQLNNIKFLTHRLKSIKNLNNITLLTSRSNKKGHLPLIKKLEKELNKDNIKLDNSIFVNDLSELKNNNTADSSTKKLIYLIQSLIGFKIQDDKFVPLLEQEYDTVYFYDDEDKNINICNTINEQIRIYFENSSEVIKTRILNKKLNNKKLITNLVTSNQVNQFIKNEINIILNN